MKRWKLITTIDAEDEYDAAQILLQLDRDANRGDGIFIRVCDGIKPLEDRLNLISTVKDK